MMADTEQSVLSPRSLVQKKKCLCSSSAAECKKIKKPSYEEKVISAVEENQDKTPPSEPASPPEEVSPQPTEVSPVESEEPLPLAEEPPPPVNEPPLTLKPVQGRKACTCKSPKSPCQKLHAQKKSEQSPPPPTEEPPPPPPKDEPPQEPPPPEELPPPEEPPPPEELPPPEEPPPPEDLPPPEEPPPPEELPPPEEPPPPEELPPPEEPPSTPLSVDTGKKKECPCPPPCSRPKVKEICLQSKCKTEGMGGPEPVKGEEPSVSELKAALAMMEKKCRTKDMIITALTAELSLHAKSGIFENLLSNVCAEEISLSEPPRDFDREQLCEFLKRPEGYPARAPPPHPDPVSAKGATVGCPPTCPGIKTPVCNQDGILPSPMGLRILRKVGADSLLLGWDVPSGVSFVGYEIFVNGILKQKVRSASRNKALLTNLDLCSKVVITMYALTDGGRSSDPASVVYPDPCDPPISSCIC